MANIKTPSVITTEKKGAIFLDRRRRLKPKPTGMAVTGEGRKIIGVDRGEKKKKKKKKIPS